MIIHNIENFKLTSYNAYRIESVCSRAWFPESENELLKLYQNNKDKRFIILGNGNNIILSKDYYEEEFIIFNKCFDEIEVNESVINAEAGATLLQISEIALKHQLTGFRNILRHS